jgi:hypothetical protein
MKQTIGTILLRRLQEAGAGIKHIFGVPRRLQHRTNAMAGRQRRTRLDRQLKRTVCNRKAR